MKNILINLCELSKDLNFKKPKVDAVMFSLPLLGFQKSTFSNASDVCIRENWTQKQKVTSTTPDGPCKFSTTFSEMLTVSEFGNVGSWFRRLHLTSTTILITTIKSRTNEFAAIKKGVLLKVFGLPLTKKNIEEIRCCNFNYWVSNYSYQNICKGPVYELRRKGVKCV